jgi:hypothetical protein
MHSTWMGLDKRTNLLYHRLLLQMQLLLQLNQRDKEK